MTWSTLTPLLSLLLIFSLLSAPSSAVSTETLKKASDVLSDAGYSSMAVALKDLIASLNSTQPRNPTSPAESVAEAAAKLRSFGELSQMASYIESRQFLADVVGPNPEAKNKGLTVFAPYDPAMAEQRLVFSETSRHVAGKLLRRHVVPGRQITWNKLWRLEEGSRLATCDGGDGDDEAGGFVIEVGRREDGVLVLNGAPVYTPEIYNDGWLVIHGVFDVLDPSLVEEAKSTTKLSRNMLLAYVGCSILFLWAAVHMNVFGIML